MIDTTSLLGRFVGLSEALNAESDRGAAVLSGEACNEALRDLLKKNGHKVPKPFAHRIASAKSHGLLTPDTAAQLDLLRDVRNGAGHTTKGYSLKAWETHVRVISESIYPHLKESEPFDVREALVRVGLVAATALRGAVELPTSNAAHPVDLTGIIGVVRSEVGIGMIVLLVVMIAFYLVWKHREKLVIEGSVDELFKPDAEPTKATT